VQRVVPRRVGTRSFPNLAEAGWRVPRRHGPQKRTFELWSSSVREQEVRQTRSVLAVTLRGRPYSRPLMYFLLLFSLS
jgi:hypothetical protein